jgi:hypothetical protein
VLSLGIRAASAFGRAGADKVALYLGEASEYRSRRSSRTPVTFSR